jgi:hypothetical protein
VPEAVVLLQRRPIKRLHLAVLARMQGAGGRRQGAVQPLSTVASHAASGTAGAHGVLRAIPTPPRTHAHTRTCTHAHARTHART